MLVLGIETSCDETSVAIIRDNNILSHFTYSQMEHEIFGGVIPELAARAHLKTINVVLQKALISAQITLKEIDAIAVTSGPGLIGGLVVGVIYAKTIALVHNTFYLAVNHLQGHALMPKLAQNLAFPYLLLLISGGHTQFVAVLGVDKYKILGTTMDDAIGEAFDKTARVLGLPYPGGKHIECLAERGDAFRFIFPKPMLYSQGCNFSLSGLKTAVKTTVLKLQQQTTITKKDKQDIAASFQHTIVELCVYKSKKAYDIFNKLFGIPQAFVVSGGVSANLAIREGLEKFCSKVKLDFYAPPLDLCTDNALMIAYAGLLKLQLGLIDNLSSPINPRWSLEDI